MTMLLQYCKWVYWFIFLGTNKSEYRSKEDLKSSFEMKNNEGKKK